MGKRILVTSTDLMMVQFLVPHIVNLADKGYEVEIACSDVGGRIDEIRRKLCRFVREIHLVRLHRNPVHPGNLSGYIDMKRIIDNGRFDIIWTNEPVMGVVTRIAGQRARKSGTKILYMVHGFHFYDGAPKLNWILYYPIEKILASKADMICTVNEEDYKRAKQFKVKRVEYIHGIGINTDRFSIENEKSDIRKELGLQTDDIIVLSVGELNENKNQKVIIQAMAKLKHEKIHYILCGKGDQKENLEKLTNKLGIKEKVHFLGYRNDIADIYRQSDIYVMPSKREGLPVASLEAMFCGLPLVTSNIRGLTDIMEEGVTGYMYAPDDVDGFVEGIKKLTDDGSMRKTIEKKNKEVVIPYCVENTSAEVYRLLCRLEK